jgi:hypothetical protein
LSTVFTDEMETEVREHAERYAGFILKIIFPGT